LKNVNKLATARSNYLSWEKQMEGRNVWHWNLWEKAKNKMSSTNFCSIVMFNQIKGLMYHVSLHVFSLCFSFIFL